MQEWHRVAHHRDAVPFPRDLCPLRPSTRRPPDSDKAVHRRQRYRRGKPRPDRTHLFPG